MKLYLIALIILTLLFQTQADYMCTTDSYNQFRLDFGKKDNLTPEKYQAKFAKFCWSLEKVRALNA